MLAYALFTGDHFHLVPILVNTLVHTRIIVACASSFGSLNAAILSASALSCGIAGNDPRQLDMKLHCVCYIYQYRISKCEKDKIHEQK